MRLAGQIGTPGPVVCQPWYNLLNRLPALDYVFTLEHEALVDSLVKPGHRSTPGYTDPSYPPNGRVRNPVPSHAIRA
jgi:hypothetical protein